MSPIEIIGGDFFFSKEKADTNVFAIFWIIKE